MNTSTTNAVIETLRRERRSLRNELAAEELRRDSITERCDQLAKQIEDCNIRIATEHAISRGPIRMEIVEP